MRPGFKVALFGIAVTFILIDMFGEPEHDDQKRRADSSGDTLSDRSYGMRGADDSWPPLPEGAVVSSSDRLMSNYYLVIDGSGSMADDNCTSMRTKLHESVAAIRNFAGQLSTDTRLGITVFDVNGVREVMPLSRYSDVSLDIVLNSLSVGGGTPLADAMRIGQRALEQQAITQSGSGEYNLIVVTDGEANDDQDVKGTIRDIVISSPITIHAIGFCIGQEHALNQRGITLYTAANDGQSLRKGLSSVLAESPSFNIDSFDPAE